ncbi:hypothetical protein FUAX_23070 [Fulvitalea axinellae]|uniref:Uncharacterized protein n=1 Tax=Fulvitalea axinellae TaxID=1182444 RepID=A0AAU9CKP4_9BACT|nr:hypothetical protein FUAX_23070 [Fulvitalea axinellae]
MKNHKSNKPKGFETPPDYFEKLPYVIQGRIQGEEKRSKGARIRKIQTAVVSLSTAAMAFIAFRFGPAIWPSMESSQSSAVEIALLSQIDSTDIVNYLAYSDDISLNDILEFADSDEIQFDFSSLDSETYIESQTLQDDPYASPFDEASDYLLN